MKFNIIDLFAGCGGLTDGFLQTGKFHTLAAVDWELPTVETLKRRLVTKYGYDCESENILHFDIQRTDELINGYSDPVYGGSEGIDSLIGDSEVDFIIGGPPCQAYSIAGRVRDTNRMQDDYRNFLFESYVNMVQHYNPKAFVFENVEGILSAKPGGISIVDRVKEAFERAGYEITHNLRVNALFDTSFYNVPQKRKRVIIFGVKKGKNSSLKVQDFYRRLRSKATEKPLNSKMAFENLPKIYPARIAGVQSHSVVLNGTPLLKNHEPRMHNARDMEIFGLLAEDIKSGGNKYASSKALIELYRDKTGKDSNFHKYHVIREDRPSNTIPAHLYKDGLRHIHPDPQQARSITVREAARLQSFDDDFEFLGSRGDQYKMIGNAVPPAFSKTIAETIVEIFNPSSSKKLVAPELTLLTARGKMHTAGGLNWGSNALNHTRPYDSYIPIHIDFIKANPGLIDKKYVHQQIVNFHWDDGTDMEVLFEGNGSDGYPKQIASAHHKDILGKYFRRRLGLPANRRIEKEDLINYGRTTVTIQRVDASNYNVDFSV